MKKTSLVITFVVIAVTIGIFYQYSDIIGSATHTTKPALKLTILTGVNDSYPVINNVTFEQTIVPIFYRSADSPSSFPDIDVEAKNDSLYSSPVTYWASAVRPIVPTDNQTYVLTLLFREPYTPKAGDFLYISIKMNNFRGDLEYKTTAFYVWK